MLGELNLSLNSTKPPLLKPNYSACECRACVPHLCNSIFQIISQDQAKKGEDRMGQSRKEVTGAYHLKQRSAWFSSRRLLPQDPVAVLDP